MVVAAGYDDLFRAAADAAEPFQIPAKALPKNEQAFLEGEIIDLETKIRNSDIIQSNSGSNVVQMGQTVVIKDLEFDEEMTYSIVGSAEADPTEFRISNESPVGAAIIGQKVGSTVEVHVPAGVLQYKIMEIKA